MANPPSTPRQRRGRLFIIGFLLILAAVVGTSLFTNLTRQANSGSAPKPAPMASVSLKFEKLEIVSGEKTHAFFVEVMRTDKERQNGLMFRQTMPPDNGMLFDFERDQMVTMWMKNTYLPLDMIFILKDGRIHRIEERTEPMSERTISSGAPVRAVLELNGGVAARLGIKAGDLIKHPVFK
jgi:uncharacterized protein